MKAGLLFLFALGCYTTVAAQSTTVITVRAGSKLMDVLTTADVFYYPQFTNGKVFFRDGTEATAKLNYNYLFDEMHFIDPRGDTLALANEKIIKFISIQKDTFFYGKGYIRLLASSNQIKLADKQAWQVDDNRITGAFNTSNTTSAITSYTAFNVGGSRYSLVASEDLTLRKGKQYYIGDKYNRFTLASKKDILMLFAKEQRQIESYLKENNIDFTKREDLEKLVHFLGDF